MKRRCFLLKKTQIFSDAAGFHLEGDPRKSRKNMLRTMGRLFLDKKKSGVMYLQGGPPADRYKWGEITPVNVLPEPCAFFLGGGLKNPALHCNDVYMFVLWLKKGGGAKIFVQRIPLRPMFWSFGGFLFTEGARPREELCVCRRCFQKKKQRSWPFDLFFWMVKTWPFQGLLVTSKDRGWSSVTNWITWQVLKRRV